MSARVGRICVVALWALLAPCLLAHRARAAETPAEWVFAPAQVPPPPPGLTPASETVPVGRVGQISFWAPNRGLLIDGGDPPVVPAGLYAYDGASWHLLSTVCGGAEGRIAWVGADEFWTISDQRGGQNLPPGFVPNLKSISLCHFLNGQVVVSYAMPLGQSDSYVKMDAAACFDPTDCWFGGETGTGEHPGAFHLHWNGESVSVVYSEEAHAVTSMVNYEGELVEGLQMEGGVFGEPAVPALFRTIAPVGAHPFTDLFPESASGVPLPEYPSLGPPYVPTGFMLATNGSPVGAETSELWAVANRSEGIVGQAPTVLRCAGGACLVGQWSQIMPSPTTHRQLAEAAVYAPPAPEPGSETAWLSVPTEGPGSAAEVARVAPEQGVVERVALPRENAAELGRLGAAGAITCPAHEDCWMATEQGWLFHYTDGAALPVDEDPSFAGVITYRPPDAGLTALYPNGFAEETQSAQTTTAKPAPKPPAETRTKVRRKLVTHLHVEIRHGRYTIAFTLTGNARVGLIAKRGKGVVARIPARTLHRGRHQLSFAFDQAHPPTSLKFSVVPPGSGTSGTGGLSGGGNTLET